MLVLVLAYAVAEVAGGIAFDSLALLADAGHMAADAASLALALVAVGLAMRPATTRHSFGWRRAEILAALVNGLALVAIAVWIFVEAAGRLADPPPVRAGGTLVVAVGGLAVNVASAAILHRSAGGGLNTRAAFLHVLSDLAGSVGVIVSALVILATGWEAADPVVSILIGVLILLSSWRVVRESLDVLLEAAPAGVDADAVGRRMAGCEGVVEVHDLHIWTITSGFPALSAHVTVGRDEDCHLRRRELGEMLARDFGISHTTLQVDHEAPRVLPVPSARGSRPA